MTARFNTLVEWLKWQETLHSAEMDFDLARIKQVAANLDILHPAFPIVTVAGTNGKGSSLTLLNAILSVQGYKTGLFTSPHIHRYNERISIGQTQAEDDSICDAFEAINHARKAISLTYFEFGALAAMYLFVKNDVDVALLEVGLGGRLDAVNIWSADAMLITNIAIDHQAWLGNNRDIIGYEKAGIMRTGRPVVFAEPDMPHSVKAHADDIGANLIRLGTDYQFDISHGEATWQWSSDLFNQQYSPLPKPGLKGDFQYQNAAGVLACLNTISDRLPVNTAAIGQGLREAFISGRLEVLSTQPEWVVDVAHNPHSCQALADWLNDNPVKGETYAIFSMLADKDIEESIEILKHAFDAWHIVPLAGARAMSVEDIKSELVSAGVKQPIKICSDFDEAIKSLNSQIKATDRVVAFGSFLVVSDLKQAYAEL